MLLHDLRLFAGGVVLANALPHLICALMGRPFQSPFAEPRGQGLSSSLVNALWGAFNLAIAYLLLVRGVHVDLHAIDQAGAMWLGITLMACFCARQFGRFNGGNHPTESQPRS